MRKFKVVGILVAALATVGIWTMGTAFAWHPVVEGSAKCAENGTVLVTWKVSNGENSTMHATSRLGNFNVAKHDSKTLTETVASDSGWVTLEVTGSWDYHEQNVKSSAKVKAPKCEQPPVTTTTTTLPPPPPEEPPAPPVTPEPPVVEEAAPAVAIVTARVPFTG